MRLGFVAPLIALFGCGPQIDHSQLTSHTRTIVGGIPVDADSDIASSAVLILTDWAPIKKREICTGTLIARNIVLTAAHCVLRNDDSASPVPAKQISLYFGNAQFDAENQENPVSKDLARREASQVVFHDKHIGHAQDHDVNDIALIQFRGTLPAGLKPASILPKSQALVPLQDRAEVEVAGFGLTQAGVPTNQLSLMQTELITAQDEGESIILLSTSQVEDRAICGGDSGGPSFVDIDGELYLWAINLQSNCHTKSWVLNLADFHAWIKKKAAELHTQATAKALK